MNTITLVTADELLTMPTDMGKRYELAAGELRIVPLLGWRHGRLVSQVRGKLLQFVEQHDLGMMFGAETGFRLASDPDTVRAPDIAFVAKQNVPKDLPEEGFWPGPPDLAVEVLSPSDRTGEVDEKINAWLDAGCSSVWIVNPKLATVTTYHSRTDVQVKAAGELLEGDPTLPGFSCPVDALI